MVLLLPPPPREPPGDDGSQAAGGQESPDNGPSQGHQPKIPTVDQILEMLVQLTGAVMTGVVSTSQANLVHRNLRTILEVQLKRDDRGGQTLDREAIVELCRERPETLRILEPFLTDDQVAWLLSEINREGEA